MAHKKVISLPVCLRPGHLHVTTCPAYPVGIRRGMLTTTLTRTDGPACGQIALPNPNSPPLFLWFHRLRLRIAIATILTWKKIVPSTCCTILLLLPVDGITVPVEATAGLPDRALYYRYYVTPSSSPCSGTSLLVETFETQSLAGGWSRWLDVMSGMNQKAAERIKNDVFAVSYPVLQQNISLFRCGTLDEI